MSEVGVWWAGMTGEALMERDCAACTLLGALLVRVARLETQLDECQANAA